MLKKTITYEDFNGDTVSEDFFFHLSQAELVELELSHQGGLSAALERIVAAEDGKGIIAEFKGIILSSYGQKSLDGKRFVKNDRLREEFESSAAYSVLFMELVTNTESAIEFVNGVIPQDLAAEAAALAKDEEKPDLKAVGPTEVRIVTPEEMDKMSAEELQAIGPKIQSGEVRLGKSELETS